ncbi:MAG: C-GCAxxG-C-C family protein [Thermoguttaceae bacterium]|jgi:C_GCAxxG_C_C family probable redox protein
MTKIEEAVAYFREGFSCSQAIMAAYGPMFGLDRDTALKIASGFGGGMGRMAETCGAVTGAFMVLGLKFGSATADREAKEAVYAVVREFAARFKAIHGSILCRDLLGCNLNTPDGLALAQEKKLFSTVCPPYVETAAEILEELLCVTVHGPGAFFR